MNQDGAREPFTTANGLVGWLTGSGPEVLLLHGGPGMSDYMELMLPELDGLRVASFQQRGIAPSTLDPPYDVPTAVSDVVAVLDHLGWSPPVVIAHSWGGHLLLHLLASVPDRIGAALVIDPLGAVGDGGLAQFGAEMLGRVPEHHRGRLAQLAAREEAGTYTNADAQEAFEITWPSYFSAPERATPLPPIVIDVAVNEQTFASIMDLLPTFPERLAGCPVSVRFVHGAGSPMPVTASTDAARILGAPVDVVPDAGHFPNLEVPGCVRRSLDLLLGSD